MVRRHGINPRDWKEAQTVEKAAAELVATMDDAKVARLLRSKYL